MIIVPILVVIAIYIPKFMASKRMVNQEMEIATGLVYKVRDVLENRCANVMMT